MSPAESTIGVLTRSEGVVAGFVTAGAGVGSGKGAGAGVGAGAIATGAGGGPEIAAGARGASLPAKTAPFSRLTRFNGATLPAKNSAAVKDGSEDGAGG